MKVILFDGVCNLCNGLVNWLIDRDRTNQFHFAALQSAYGRSVVSRFNVNGDSLNTLILLDDERIYLRSTGVLRILKDLGGIYRVAYIFIIVPPFIRNFFYNIVAANRYRWFGKHETCRVPTPELKQRFLE